LKPKSICIALSVAVRCEKLSSRRFSIFGSKVVSELQSRGLIGLVEDKESSAEYMERGLGAVFEGDPVASFCIENVNADCLSETFSLRRRPNISRKFSFSCSVASFFASSSATLSSSCTEKEKVIKL